KTVRLELNGETVAEQSVRLEPRGRAQAEFPPLELRSGANRVTVSIAPGDSLGADDRRYLVLKRPEPRTVLVVASDARGRAALFTGAALETLRGLSLTAERIAPSDLGTRPLAGYSFVVVTDAGVLGPAETNALQSYVDGGGALLMAF